MTHAERLLALQQLLNDHQALWRPQPFKQQRPDWCRQHPQLSDALLALSDSELARLMADQTALWAWLAAYLPVMGQLRALCTLPQAAGSVAHPEQEPGPHFANHIPGRKWQQIGAFAAAMQPVAGPVLEWCGGKGHLGRLVSWQSGVAVTTVEHNPKLCAEGRQLAERSGQPQGFVCADVLREIACLLRPTTHAVALHACGELHRHLLRQVVDQGVQALDLAPCCYHHLLDGDYQPMSHRASLVLQRDDLRLAVTGAATATARELRLRDQEMAWKLGYLALLATMGEAYRPLRPINKAWMRLDFTGFCQCLAQREGDELPSGLNWEALERHGWQRQRDSQRLSLLRLAFRRAIELYLVLDMACYLEEQGYQVRVQLFCRPDLTPRNFLLSAALAENPAAGRILHFAG